MGDLTGYLFDPKDISEEMRPYFEETETQCGAGWVRDIKHRRRTKTDTFCPKHLQGKTSGLASPGWRKNDTPNAYSVTTGWRQACPCAPQDPVPQTVLDPFGGAGTTALVADRLGHNAILCELNPDYVEMTRQRLVDDGGMFMQVEVE